MEDLIRIGEPNAMILPNAMSFAASYIAVLMLIGFALALRVVRRRRDARIGLGDGDDRELRKRIRAHGNFSEYAPLVMLLLIALVLVGAREWMIHAVGLVGTAGRILHALGVSRASGASVGRTAGMMLTFAALVCGALALLVLAWR